MDNIFSGLKILDCTRVFSGPFATRFFADYGATVYKVETSDFFDESRNFAPIKNNHSGYFEMLNRGKIHLDLNFKDEKDLQKLYEIIKDIDVFVENFSPNIKKKLKIDYDTLSKINPKLIYGTLNGYGDISQKKAYDVIIQGECGLASLNGENKPMKNATAIIDTFSGNSLALGITSALYKREKTGKGDYITISMLGCGLQLLEQNIIETSITNKNPDFVGNGDSAIFPFGFFKAKDFDISLAIGNDLLWEKFVETFIPDVEGKYLSNNSRLENKIFLTNKIEEIFFNYDTYKLLETLDNLGIPCGKINKMQDLLNNKNLFKNKNLAEINHEKLGKCVVPCEYINFNNFEIEKIKSSPKI